MLELSLATAANDAAIELDRLRLGRDIGDLRGVERTVLALRSAFPAGGNVANFQVCPRDVVIINEVLEAVRPAGRTQVDEVIRDLVVALDDVDSAWSSRRYDQQHVKLFLVLSRVVCARLGRTGHTF